MNDVLLRCVDIKKQYRTPSGKLDVLRGVSFELKRGEIHFILGRSGSGKSTLLHILGGLDKPTSGKVYLDDAAFDKMSDTRRAALRNKRIGFVFQFYHLLPELNVLENVMLPGMIARKKVSDRAHVLLDILGLSERKKHFPSQLSGGEQQRAALARALVNNPDIVLCDEPTGNLDEENAENIYRLIEKLNTTEKQTFCIVTHEEAVANNKQNVYRLKEGILTQ
jgi:lipoprotein-releasing system ATP-binding protein